MDGDCITHARYSQKRVGGDDMLKEENVDSFWANAVGSPQRTVFGAESSSAQFRAEVGRRKVDFPNDILKERVIWKWAR